MNRQRALNFIRESLELAKTANPEQRVKLLKLVKECYSRVRSQPNLSNQDYLDEK